MPSLRFDVAVGMGANALLSAFYSLPPCEFSCTDGTTCDWDGLNCMDQPNAGCQLLDPIAFPGFCEQNDACELNVGETECLFRGAGDSNYYEKCFDPGQVPLESCIPELTNGACNINLGCVNIDPNELCGPLDEEQCNEDPRWCCQNEPAPGAKWPG